MPRISTGTWAVSFVLVTALAANAQEITSPFTKKGSQAWESSSQSSNQSYSDPSYSRSYVPPQDNASSNQGAYQPPKRSMLSAATPPKRPTAMSTRVSSNIPAGIASSSTYSSPSYAAPITPKSSTSTQPAVKSSGAKGTYYPGRSVQPGMSASPFASKQSLAYGATQPSAPSQSESQPESLAGAYYNPPQNSYGTYGQPNNAAPQNSGAPFAPQQYAQSNLPPRMPGNTGGNPYPPRTPQTPPQRPEPQSWTNRLGLNNIAHKLSGYLKLGAAGTQRDDWSEDFIADGALIGELSALTSGGIEYGIGAEVRGQYDQYRRGFGGRIGDCPATLAGCPSITLNGTPTAIRGHTSQFYTSGLSNADDAEVQLEGAYFFLRSAYGDVTAGRDDGSAYLFSLGAPTLLAVGASNSPVDYTGLDAVKTINDASGFAEKITYTSPRLLGDHIVGVQFGASYAPDSKACGVDYCVQSNGKDESGALSPDIEDVLELGVALDKTFANGLSVEMTGTYARGSEISALAAFDDLEAYGLGLELGYMDWTLGGSYLQSNNGLMNGDYSAYDVGLTWQPNQWGVTIGYGHAEDDSVGLTSDQGVFGISYDFSDRYRLGTGVQYIEREVPFDVGGVITSTKEDAMSVFVEGRVTF